jgi:hypothetical protein
MQSRPVGGPRARSQGEGHVTQPPLLDLGRRRCGQSEIMKHRGGITPGPRPDAAPRVGYVRVPAGATRPVTVYLCQSLRQCLTTRRMGRRGGSQPGGRAGPSQPTGGTRGTRPRGDGRAEEVDESRSHETYGCQCRHKGWCSDAARKSRGRAAGLKNEQKPSVSSNA